MPAGVFGGDGLPERVHTFSFHNGPGCAFVAATEHQVCRHLQSHLDQLPVQDSPSRALLTRMLEDESRHATTALAAGGTQFPSWMENAMTQVSRVMTQSTYYV